MKAGAYCPATNARCDRPCALNECQRVKLDEGSTRCVGGLLEDVPRPPPPDGNPFISPAQMRASRAYLHMTLEAFGGMVGISPQTLSRFECGRSTPHENTLRRIIGELWDNGLEVFGTGDTNRGIRDRWSKEERAKHENSHR